MVTRTPFIVTLYLRCVSYNNGVHLIFFSDRMVDFYFCHHIRLAFLSPFFWSNVYGWFFRPRRMRPEQKDDQLSPSAAAVKNMWSFSFCGSYVFVQSYLKTRILPSPTYYCWRSRIEKVALGSICGSGGKPKVHMRTAYLIADLNTTAVTGCRGGCWLSVRKKLPCSWTR